MRTGHSLSTEELTTKTTVKVVFSYPFFDERSKKQWNFSKPCLEKGALTWEQFQQAAKDAKFEVVNAAGGAYVPKADLDTKAQELTTANNTIKDLRATAKAWDGKDPKKLEDDLKDLQTRYDTDTANIRRDAAIDLALTRAHARDPQLTRAALSMDDIKIGADGKITGLDAQVESLKKDKAWLFEEDGAGQSGKQGDKGGNPNGGQGGGYNPQSGGNPNTVNDLGSALAEVYNTKG